MQLRDLLAGALAPRVVECIPRALPDSVNALSKMALPERGLHLPIVTSLDLPLARAGAGPAWHAYPRENTDLKFVAALYDVGVGVQTRDARIRTGADLAGKRVGAPARPSAVRLLTETLLRDGWKVTAHLVDLAPTEALAALEAGAVDAISWNLALPSPHGLRPMLGAEGGLRYLPIDAPTLAGVNAANHFELTLTPASADAPSLLSFAQALAAWDETPTDVVIAMLEAMSATQGVKVLTQWPALSAEQMHDAARAFFAGRGVSFR